MLSTVEVMPESARLWVYQADRVFSSEESEKVHELTSQFVRGWEAHGTGLAASYVIEHDQFLILMVDESHEPASGCSIDSSVALIRKIESSLGLSLLDRSKIAVYQNGKLSLHPMNRIKAAIQSGEIHPDATVFNNAVSTYGEWQKSWRQSAKDSWMKRFFE